MLLLVFFLLLLDAYVVFDENDSYFAAFFFDYGQGNMSMRIFIYIELLVDKYSGCSTVWNQLSRFYLIISCRFRLLTSSYISIYLYKRVPLRPFKYPSRKSFSCRNSFMKMRPENRFSLLKRNLFWKMTRSIKQLCLGYFRKFVWIHRPNSIFFLYELFSEINSSMTKMNWSLLFHGEDVPIVNKYGQSQCSLSSQSQ